MARKYYIIRQTLIATEENKSFDGENRVYLYGKNEESFILPDNGRCIESVFISNYGYNRIQDAKRNWCYRNPENTKNWSTTKNEILLATVDGNTVSYENV